MRQGAIKTVVAACAVLAWPALHAAEPPVAWLSAELARRQLDQPVSIDWSGVPVRQAVQNLARSQRIAMLLDRRVDPDQKIEMRLSNVRLEEALARIAAQLKLGTSRVGPVVYFGPEKTTERLRTLVELRKQEIARLPPAVRTGLTAQKRSRWDMLATPRELLAEAARDHGVQIEPLTAVTHDLWPAGELPPLGLAERVSLIAAQFDLTFELADEGRTVRLVPMPDRAVLEKTYAHANPAAVIGQLKTVLKHSELQSGNRKLVVRGPAEEHEMVESLLAGRTVRQITVTPGKKVYQLDIVMPVGRLIDELGRRLDLQFELDEPAIRQAGLSLDKDVTVSVKDASEEQLLKAVLTPAGLRFERDGKRVVVRPK